VIKTGNLDSTRYKKHTEITRTLRKRKLRCKSVGHSHQRLKSCWKE